MKRLSLLLVFCMLFTMLSSTINAQKGYIGSEEELMNSSGFFIYSRLNERQLDDLEYFYNEMTTALKQKSTRRIDSLYGDRPLILDVALILCAGNVGKILAALDFIGAVIAKNHDYEARLILRELENGYQAIRDARLDYREYDRMFGGITLAEVEFWAFEREEVVNGERLSMVYLSGGGDITRVLTRNGWATPGGSWEYRTELEEEDFEPVSQH